MGKRQWFWNNHPKTTPQSTCSLLHGSIESKDVVHPQILCTKFAAIHCDTTKFLKKQHYESFQRSSKIFNKFQVMLTSLSFWPGFDHWLFSQKTITSSLATIRPGAETGRHRFMVGWGSQGFPRLESENRIEKQSFPEGSLSFFRCDWKIMKNGLWCRSFQSNMRVLTPW